MKASEVAWSLTAAAVGGACGGAIVGLVEAGLLTVSSGPGGEYWLFPFAVASYGLGGMIIGIGFAIAATVLLRSKCDCFSPAAALALLLLGGVVARYHIIQRVFHEELVMVSPLGIAVHIGLVVGIGLVALGAMSVGRVLQRHQRGVTVGGACLVATMGVSTGAAVLAAPHKDATPVARNTAPGAAGHPNVILIVTDTLRADAVGIFGAGPKASPALDRLAAESVRFPHAYSQSSWTRPSVATILTSQYPSVHGAVHKLDPLPDGVTTLAEAFRAAGYWTAGFVSNINVAPVFNFQQGFEEYTYLEPDFYFLATDSATRLAIYKGLRVLHERFYGDRIYFNHYYQDAAVVDEAVGNWLQQGPPQPFFLLIHYMDPHDPYFEHPYNGHGIARVTNPNPPRDRLNEMRTLYAEDVSYLDAHLEKLFARLRALGLYDDTVIALSADHGEEFQEHGGWWHGTSLYEEVVHVPLIIKRAHERRAGDTEVRVARTLDIAPTLMAAAGLTVPAAFAGRDLFGTDAGTPEPLFAEEDLEGNLLASLRVGSWKVITANPANPRGLQPVELYDLNQDAGERRNLAAEESTRAADMLRQLAEERSRIGRRAS